MGLKRSSNFNVSNGTDKYVRDKTVPNYVEDNKNKLGKLELKLPKNINKTTYKEVSRKLDNKKEVIVNKVNTKVNGIKTINSNASKVGKESVRKFLKITSLVLVGLGILLFILFKNHKIISIGTIIVVLLILEKSKRGGKFKWVNYKNQQSFQSPVLGLSQ